MAKRQHCDDSDGQRRDETVDVHRQGLHPISLNTNHADSFRLDTGKTLDPRNGGIPLPPTRHSNLSGHETSSLSAGGPCQKEELVHCLKVSAKSAWPYEVAASSGEQPRTSSFADRCDTLKGSDQEAGMAHWKRLTGTDGGQIDVNMDAVARTSMPSKTTRPYVLSVA